MYSTFDTEITVFTMWQKDKDRRWVSTHVMDCSWYGKQAATVGTDGLNTADQYTVRMRPISMPEGYLKPEEYNALPNPTGHWTLQNGDVVVKGDVTAEVVTGITDITKLFTNCFTITSVADNRRGPAFMQHIRIEGK